MKSIPKTNISCTFYHLLTSTMLARKANTAVRHFPKPFSTNWVMKLNFFLFFFFFVFKMALKDFPFCSPILLTLWFRYLQTRIKKTCMYAQTQKFPEKSKKNPFSSNLPTWISNISSDVYHRAAPSSHWAKQTLKKLILWGKTAVDRSSWIKAWLYKY